MNTIRKLINLADEKDSLPAEALLMALVCGIFAVAVAVSVALAQISPWLLLVLQPIAWVIAARKVIKHHEDNNA